MGVSRNWPGSLRLLQFRAATVFSTRNSPAKYCDPPRLSSWQRYSALALELRALLLHAVHVLHKDKWCDAHMSFIVLGW